MRQNTLDPRSAEETRQHKGVVRRDGCPSAVGTPRQRQWRLSIRGVDATPPLDVSSDSAGSSKGIDAEADKERVVCEMGKEINLTFERRSVGGEPQYSDNYLEWISSQKRKSYDTYDSRGRQVRVTIRPTHTHGSREHNGMLTAGRQLTSENDLENGQYVKTWLLSLNGKTLDPSRVERIVTVMVPTEWYVNGEAYYAMTALPTVEVENLGILTRKERKMVDSGLEQLVRHDETQWSSIRGRRPPLPSGCRAFLMVLFSSMIFLGQLARGKNVSVSFSNNQIHEARTREDREHLDVQMEKRFPLDCCLQVPESHTACLETGTQRGAF